MIIDRLYPREYGVLVLLKKRLEQFRPWEKCTASSVIIHTIQRTVEDRRLAGRLFWCLLQCYSVNKHVRNKIQSTIILLVDVFNTQQLP